MAAAALRDGAGAVNVIKAFLEQSITTLDKELVDTRQLYGRPDAGHYVAALLCERGQLFKLLALLTEQVDINDADHAEE